MPHLNGSAAGAGTALVELHGGAVGRTTRDDRPRPASRFCLAGKEGERCWARDARTSQQRQGQERSRARYQRTWLSCGFRRSAWQPTRQQKQLGAKFLSAVGCTHVAPYARRRSIQGASATPSGRLPSPERRPPGSSVGADLNRRNA